MAAVISDVTRTHVAVCALDPKLLLAQAAQHGFRQAMNKELCLMFAYYDEHGLVGNGRVLGMIMGSPGGTFRAMFERTLLEPGTGRTEG